MAEINAPERKRPNGALTPADEKLLVGWEEYAEMPSISRRVVDYLAANEQTITRPDLPDEVSFLRLPELKSICLSIEIQPLRIDPGEQFSCAGSTRTANGRSGKICEQTMGRRAHIQVTTRMTRHRGQAETSTRA